MKYKYVVVGAGLAGLTIAERIAKVMNEKVLVIEKRNHIGGNVYDSYNEDGILIHNYGPHTFHTSNKTVFDYICQFCNWHHYEHHVISWVDGKFVPIPICIDTINELYGLDLDEKGMEEYINSVKVSIPRIQNSEDVVLSQGGYDIYEKFFKYFTYKQWGVYPSELDSSVISRIPFRMNHDTRYFTDTYQGNPIGGYTKMCEKMISSDNIKVLLNTDYKEVINDIHSQTMIYTGPLDYYFDYCYGKLKWRSIHFSFETYEKESFQPTASSRYPSLEYPWTRITEFKKMTGQIHSKTTILKEYPCFGDEPFYTYPTQSEALLAKKYKEKAAKENNVIFIGRLAEYKYYDMDDVVEKALDIFYNHINKAEK